MDVDYQFYTKSLVTEEMYRECSDLYSKHYGYWSRKSPKNPVEPVKLSPSAIEKWLNVDEASLYQARVDGKLIGYAIAIRIKTEISIKNKKKYDCIVSWVTQLVVHKEFRNRGVAKSLLFSIWGFSDHYAWGIITANPYAVRALEKATRRRCLPIRIKQNNIKFFNIGKEYISYMNEETKLDISDSKSIINTNFYVDHSEVEQMINSISTESSPWLMGNLEEGFEWFAFTFNDQEQLSLTHEEIEKMIRVSDQITEQAYPKMLLDSGHKWASHTKTEIDFIIKNCSLLQNNEVLDIGCGQGRHSLELARRGIKVTGVDYIKEFIKNANKQASQLDLNNVEFRVEDCRNLQLNFEYDAVLCLYDVIGSFVTDDDNRNILKNIALHLKPSGFAVISVMNYELTHKEAKNFFTLSNNWDKLLELKPAGIMEKTGNIFDPEYYLVDEEAQIIYRKEQFTHGNNGLPTELIVRDKRFYKDEIVNLCEDSGLEVEWAKFVGAGRWDKSLEPTDNRAKEILLFCKKTKLVLE